jgi:hypothetical protein
MESRAFGPALFAVIQRKGRANLRKLVRQICAHWPWKDWMANKRLTLLQQLVVKVVAA